MYLHLLAFLRNNFLLLVLLSVKFHLSIIAIVGDFIASKVLFLPLFQVSGVSWRFGDMEILFRASPCTKSTAMSSGWAQKR